MELKQTKKHFSRQVISQAVEEVESGISRRVVCEKYGMAYITLCEWLSRHGSKEFLETTKPIFTAHQRRVIVSKVVEGKMTVQEANLAYRLRGRDTIKRWIRASKENNNDHLDLKESMMLPSDDVNCSDLQKALILANLKVLALETMIDVAEDQLKIKIRKKPGAKQ
jgi:transposase